MHLVVRKKGSQRAMAPVKLEFEYNSAGQGGVPYLTFSGADGKYYMIHFENIEEARTLLSQAHIVWANVCDEEALNTIKRQHGVPERKLGVLSTKEGE